MGTAHLGLAYDIDSSDAWARYQPAPIRFLRASEWSLGGRTIKHLVLYPPEVHDACDGPSGYRTNVVNELAYLAYLQRWTFNSGYSARVPRGMKEACAELTARVRSRDLKADELYIVWPRDLRAFRKAGATCGAIEGVLACVRPDAATNPLANYLKDHPEPNRGR